MLIVEKSVFFAVKFFTIDNLDNFLYNFVIKLRLSRL